MSARRSLWIPWAISALAASLLTGAVVLSLVARGSDPGLVAGSPARLAGTNLTPSGLTAVLELRVLGRGAEGVVVEARLRGPDGRPRRVETLEAVLHRPTHAREDRAVAFMAQPDGSWRAMVRPADGGLWELAVLARGEAGAANATLRL